MSQSWQLYPRGPLVQKPFKLNKPLPKKSSSASKFRYPRKASALVRQPKLRTLPFRKVHQLPPKNSKALQKQLLQVLTSRFPTKVFRALLKRTLSRPLLLRMSQLFTKTIIQKPRPKPKRLLFSILLKMSRRRRVWKETFHPLLKLEPRSARLARF